MFYDFRQNNSGGSFVYDANSGISIHVIVEADNEFAAKNKAETIGIYFDGCSTGRDCSCCGDRWSDYVDGEVVPSIYGTEVKPNQDYPAADEKSFGTKWRPEGEPDGFIHYADGRVEGFYQNTAARKDLEGQYGWGVTFNKFGVNKFLCGSNGWDETGNYSPLADRFSLGKEKSKFPPDGPTFWMHKMPGQEWGFGGAWFPTEAEADEFVAIFESTVSLIKQELKTTLTGVKKRLSPNGKKIARMWEP